MPDWKACRQTTKIMEVHETDNILFQARGAGNVPGV